MAEHKKRSMYEDIKSIIKYIATKSEQNERELYAMHQTAMPKVNDLITNYAKNPTPNTGGIVAGVITKQGKGLLGLLGLGRKVVTEIHYHN